METQKAYQILSVEDNPADRFLIQKYLDEKDVFQLHFTEDGAEALDFLFQRGKYLNSVRPDLILLDLNLQKIDGREVLEEVKANPKTSKIPVFVFTTSRSNEDRDCCLSMGAEKFISKPSDIDSMNTVFLEIKQWLQNNK